HGRVPLRARPFSVLVADHRRGRTRCRRALQHQEGSRARPLGPAVPTRVLSGMNEHRAQRRDFLKGVTALVAAGAVGARPGLARRRETPGRPGMKTAYNPEGKFELKVNDVEFRRTSAGRQLMARVYQPQGPGPFPTVLDLHGGAWRRKDRL